MRFSGKDGGIYLGERLDTTHRQTIRFGLVGKTGQTGGWEIETGHGKNQGACTSSTPFLPDYVRPTSSLLLRSHLPLKSCPLFLLTIFKSPQSCFLVSFPNRHLSFCRRTVTALRSHSLLWPDDPCPSLLVIGTWLTLGLPTHLSLPSFWTSYTFHRPDQNGDVGTPSYTRCLHRGTKTILSSGVEVYRSLIGFSIHVGLKTQNPGRPLKNWMMVLLIVVTIV